MPRIWKSKSDADGEVHQRADRPRRGHASRLRPLWRERKAYGQPSYIMELTPAFTDVIVKRYIRITGKTTVRCVRQGRELPREEIAAIFELDEEGGEQE